MMLGRWLSDTRGRVSMLVVLAGAMALVGLVGAYLAGAPGGEVRPVYAATVGSSLYVTHRSLYGDEYVIPVEPQTGESWSIMGTWVGPGPTHRETATVDVDWSANGWVMSNRVLTSNITNIILCPELSCGGGGVTHGYGYKLVVALYDTWGNWSLTRVDYTASAINNGDELDGDPCTLGDTVSPTASTFSATDFYPFWLGTIDCDVTAEYLELTYQ